MKVQQKNSQNFNQLNQQLKVNKMISCFKKVIYHNRTVLLYFFSSMNKQQAIDYHKAVLASQIIRLIDKDLQNYYPGIRVAPDNIKIQNSHQIPLRQEIIDLINAYPETEIQSKQSSQLQVKNQVELTPKLSQNIQLPQETAKRILLSYFIEGVWVHTNYCNQPDQFPQKQQTYQNIIKKNQIIDQSHLSQITMDQLYKKLIFCPTNFATRKALQSLKFPQNVLLLTGHFGIGKTYSFILYRLLSEMIFRYKHKYCQDIQNLPTQISFTIPKLIYWSINIQDSKQNIKNNLKRQCYQLNNEQLQKFNSWQENQQVSNKKKNQDYTTLLQNYLKIKIWPIVLTDGINKSASAFHKFQIYEYSQYLQKQKLGYKYVEKQAQFNKEKMKQLLQLDKKIQSTLKTQLDLSKQQVSLLLKNAQKIRNIYSILCRQFDKILYVSSIEIENNLLKRLKLRGLNNTYQIDNNKIHFGLKKDMLNSILDITELITFEVQKQIEKQNKFNLIQQEEQKLFINSLRNKLIQKLKKNPFLITPQMINKTFYNKKFHKQKTQQLWDLMIKQQNIQQLKYYTQVIINEIRQQVKKNFQQLIDKLLQKQYKYKDIQCDLCILLHKILTQSRQKQIYNNSSQILLIKLDDLFEHNKIPLNPFIEIIKNNIYDHMFYLVNKTTLLCELNNDIIVEVLENKQSYLISNVLKFNNKLFKYITSKSIQCNRSSSMLKNIIIHILSLQKTHFICKVNNNNQDKILIDFSLKSTQKTFFFKNIPQAGTNQYLNFKFLQNFKPTLQKLNIGNYLFIPQQSKVKEINQISIQLIDFVIIRKSDQGIQITAFCFTLELNVYKTKILKFLSEFSNFQDKNQTYIKLNSYNQNVSLNYVVLCPQMPPSQDQKQIDWQQQLNKQISIKKEELEKLTNSNVSNLNNGKIKKLKQQIQNLSQFILKKQNYYSFNVAFKTKFNNIQKSLLKSVSVCSFFQSSLTNNYNKKAESLIKIFDKSKAIIQQKLPKQ